MSTSTIRMGEVKHWGVFDIATDFEAFAKEVREKADAVEDDAGDHASDLYQVVDALHEFALQLLEASTEV